MTSRKAGRPRNPEPLEPFTMRLTPAAKRRLKVLAELMGKPSYALLEMGFWQLLDNQGEERRRAVETIAGTLERQGKAATAKKPGGSK